MLKKFKERTVSHIVRVKELRERRGLTQMELAILSGVSRATIARYEAGEQRRPHPATVRKLARVLKVRPEDLLEPPRGCVINLCNHGHPDLRDWAEREGSLVYI